MKIKYEMNGNECITKCPNGKAAKVASSACKYTCDHYLAVHKTDQILICNFDKKVKVNKVGQGVAIK